MPVSPDSRGVNLLKTWLPAKITEITQQPGEAFQTRVQRAIRATHYLIDQTRRLREATALLDGAEAQKELITFAASQPQPDFQYERVVLSRFVEAALKITGAKMANFQLYDPSSGTLHLVAHHGFRQNFLDFFSQVHEGETACGEALTNQARVTVEDVTESPIFFRKASLEALLDAGVRAVQSTPVLGHSGAILGVVSTHWSSPCSLKNRDLSPLDRLARKAGEWLEVGDYSNPRTISKPCGPRA